MTREILTGIPVIRAFSREKHEEERFEEANERLTKTNLFVNRCMTFMMPTMMLIMNGVSVLIIYSGAYAVDNGTMQVGNVMAFIQYAMQIIMSFLMITAMSIMLPRANVAALRINDVLKTKVSVTDPENPVLPAQDVKGTVEFDHVSFAYPEAGENVLTDISFKAEKGETIAVIGSTGSGKSTLIKMMAGVLKPTLGQITINGYPVGVNTKKIVSYLPERTYLNPSMKVKEAVDYFADFYEDFSKQKALDMLEKFGINEQDKIKSLSKGTREKVQIVLVMSREAKLYLLDEPMGGVDPAAREYILRTIISNYNEDATVVITTHLISDIENVLDEVVFIKQGEVYLKESVDDIRTKYNKSVDALFREVFVCY